MLLQASLTKAPPGSPPTKTFNPPLPVQDTPHEYPPHPRRHRPAGAESQAPSHVPRVPATASPWPALLAIPFTLSGNSRYEKRKAVVVIPPPPTTATVYWASL